MPEPLPSFPEEPDLSPRRAAELSGVSYWTVLKQIREGRLRAFRRPGGKLAIRRDDFCAWAYGDPVVPTERIPAPETAPPGRRRRPSRGSVSALRAIEREGDAG
jgi:excisionase family DNA binding protein